MKTVKIQGGLGNQLFGVAFAHSVAALSGEVVGLDASGFSADRYGRRFETEDLAADLGGMEIAPPSLLGRRLVQAIAGRLPLSPVVREPPPPADPDTLRRLVARGRYFNGYWQDERFFHDPQTVRERFGAFLRRRGGMTERCDVVVHVRTYKDEFHPSRRGTPGPEYYQAALERIADGLGAPREIVLVSDDPELALSRMGQLPAPVRFSDGQDHYADLTLMLNARALVLTNSSFSWWGGYCSDAEVVVYPRRGDLFHYPNPSRRFVVL